MQLAEVIDREIFFTKLVDSIKEFYDKDLVGHSVGMRNLHVMVLSESYDPGRFERAENLSLERAIFLGEVQVQVEIQSVDYLYFL